MLNQLAVQREHDVLQKQFTNSAGNGGEAALAVER